MAKPRDVVKLSQQDADRAGNLAMYYPEANALVPRKLVDRSKTPAFKSVPVWVTKTTGTG